MNFNKVLKRKSFTISVILAIGLVVTFFNSDKIDTNPEIKRSFSGFHDIDFDAIFTKNDLLVDESVKVSIENYFKTYWIKNNLSGGFLVAKGNKIIFEEYIGFSNFEKEIAMTNESPIHTASITKNFTAMAILKLVEINQLNLKDKVSDYLNKFPYPEMTIFDLLTHRSGLNEYGYFAEKDGVWDFEEEFLTNQKVLELYIKHKPPLHNQPNQNFSYCNTNYVFLALIIEKIVKTSYPQAMKKMIFEPLDMNNTFVFENKHFKTSSLSYFSNGKIYPWDFRDLVYGDKNIYSTPRDLLKYSQAMFSDKFLRKTLLDSAMIGYSNEKKGIKNYGLGFRIMAYDNNKKLTYHNGWWHGNNTVFVHLRDEKVTIIALGNKKSRNIYSANALAALFGDYPITFKADEIKFYTKDSLKNEVDKLDFKKLKSNKKKPQEFELSKEIDSINY